MLADSEALRPGVPDELELKRGLISRAGVDAPDAITSLAWS